MKQVLILTSDDWSALKSGQGIPLSIGGESITLMTEPGLSKIWAKAVPTLKPSENGAVQSRQERPSAPRPSFRHAPRSRYTLEHKKEILEAIRAARATGETRDAICQRYGIHNSLIYSWMRHEKAGTLT